MSSASDIILYTEAPVPGGVTAMVELLVRELGDVGRLTLIHSPAAAILPWALSVPCPRRVPVALGGTGFPPGWVIPGRVRRLFSLFKEARLVHFHLHTPFACTAAIILASLAGVPRIITTEHYIAQLSFLRRRRLVFPLALLREARIALATTIKRWSLRFVGDVVTLSKGNRSVFESTMGSRLRPLVHIIHNGIDLGKFAADLAEGLRHPLRPDDGHLLVTTVAGLNNQKGHAYLIRAIPDILRAVPQARFNFVGDGHLRSDLQAQVSSLGLDRFVTFAGNRSDVASVLASSDLFVLPSLFEGMPMSVLEAMAAGCAVVATDVGGTQDVVVSGRTGLLVPPGNPAAMAAAVIELLTNERDRLSFGHNGRQRVEQEFTAALMGERYRTLYHTSMTASRP